MARWNDSDRSPLAMLRVKAGYTQAEASVHMHLGMISLVRYENGMNDISFEDIRKAVWDTKEAAGKQTIGRSNKARRQKVSLYIKANDTHDQQ